MIVRRRQLAPAAASLAALAASPAFGQQTSENVKWRLTSSFPKSLDTQFGASTTIARVVGEMTDGKGDVPIEACNLFFVHSLAMLLFLKSEHGGNGGQQANDNQSCYGPLHDESRDNG